MKETQRTIKSSIEKKKTMNVVLKLSLIIIFDNIIFRSANTSFQILLHCSTMNVCSTMKHLTTSFDKTIIYFKMKICV